MSQTLYLMRKFNTKRIADPLRLRSEAIENSSSIYHSYPGTTSHQGIDPINTLHQSLISKQAMLLSLSKSRKKTLGSEQEDKMGPRKIRESLKETNKQIRLLRQEWHQKKQEQRSSQKLSIFIDKLKESINSRQGNLPSPPQQQIMYPIPMPFPIYNHPQHLHDKKQHRRSQGTRRTFRTTKSDSYYLENNKILNRESKAQRVKRNLRRWRKVANSILFTIFLNKFCKIARKNRLVSFQKLHPKLGSMLKTASEDLGKVLVPFFRVLMEKREVSFDIEDDEDKEVKKQLLISVRKLVMMVLQGAKKWTIKASKNPNIVAMLYHLCRHGSYACTEPLLTTEELELVCLNPRLKYVSADSNLEAAAYINTVFIKLLIYNVLLSPTKISPDLQESVIVENLEIISSIVYEFVLEIQDSYLMAVPKSYRIGNFEGLDWVKSSNSLLYGYAAHQPGQLISGLKGESWVKKHFRIETWKQEKGVLTSCIGIFHEMMAQFHQKVIKKYL